jgi:putative transcription antitermination factor YqgF
MSRRPSRYTRCVTKTPVELGTGTRRSILAVDYGRARIGLALADSEARIARPLSTMERVNRNEDMRRLRELVREHGVKQIVVGLPLRLDGTRGEMAEEVERFAQRVRKQIGVPVELVDERLTSWESIGEDDGGRGRSICNFEGIPGAARSSPGEGLRVVAELVRLN